MNKYGAKKCEQDGIKFDSMMERKYYQDLLIRLRAGEVSDIECHPVFPIELKGKPICKVELDFQYLDKASGKEIYVDVKGFYTAISRLKHKLWEAMYGEKITVVRRARKKYPPAYAAPVQPYTAKGKTTSSSIEMELA